MAFCRFGTNRPSACSLTRSVQNEGQRVRAILLSPMSNSS
jgi:hypothetical protein